jgi:hypothetical protein
MSTTHRQMDPARRAVGKKPDAAATGNARIVPRLFTSASKVDTRRAISMFLDAPQLEATTLTASRQLSSQVTAALLVKMPAELTSRQAQIVDALKRQCPGFAVMRKLVFGFRAILRGGKVTTLRRWMEEARKTVSIHWCASYGL